MSDARKDLGLRPKAAGGEVLNPATARMRRPEKTFNGVAVGEKVTFVDLFHLEVEATVTTIYSGRVVDLSLNPNGVEYVGVMYSEPPNYRPRSWH